MERYPLRAGLGAAGRYRVVLLVARIGEWVSRCDVLPRRVFEGGSRGLRDGHRSDGDARPRVMAVVSVPERTETRATA